jgi:hypothetical protein
MNKEVVKKVLGSTAKVSKKIAIGAAEYVAIQLVADAVISKIDDLKEKRAAKKRAEMGFTS